MGRRFRRRLPLGFWFILLLASLFTTRWLQTRSNPPSSLAAGKATVISVRDGRTVVIGSLPFSAQSTVAVRLIGLRTSDHAAAQQWLEQLVGKTVQVELDKRRRDIDGTFLAYVYDEDRLLNAELLSLGLAEYEPYPGDSPSVAKVLQGAAGQGRTAKKLGNAPSVITDYP